MFNFTMFHLKKHISNDKKLWFSLLSVVGDVVERQ